MRNDGDMALWFALNRLIIDYWAEVDQNRGAGAHEFYLPDAIYATGNNRFVGQAQIRAFYTRRAHGKMVTRHLVTNLRVFGEDTRMSGIMSLYRADDKSAYQEARPPTMIADFEARCALGEDGQWRFRSHELRPFFVGNDFPASITIRPQAM
jgi:hypothetical protein